MRIERIIISALLPVVFFFLETGGAVCSAQTLRVEPQISEVPDLFRKDTLSICFMGDVMMHAGQIGNARREDGSYDFSTYFMHIDSLIQDADIAVANMEFTLAGEPYTGYPCFSAPDSYADYLAGCGIDVFLAANNHILDKGSEGAARTVEIYRRLEKEKGIMFTGIAEDEQAREDNHPLFIRRKGIRLALLNFTYGTNLGATDYWPKTNYLGRSSEILQAFGKAKDADIVIALPHWGPEYQTTHSASQEEKADWLVENGADLIIGAHPHVVQDTTHIRGVPVIYSVGNAVSNMSAPDTQLELLVNVRIIRHGNGDIELSEPELTWLWCSRPGGYCSSYAVIPVEEFIGTREEWLGAWEYDKMMATYERIRNRRQ